MKIGKFTWTTKTCFRHTFSTTVTLISKLLIMKLRSKYWIRKLFHSTSNCPQNYSKVHPILLRSVEFSCFQLWKFHFRCNILSSNCFLFQFLLFKLQSYLLSELFFSSFFSKFPSLLVIFLFGSLVCSFFIMCHGKRFQFKDPQYFPIFSLPYFISSS